MALSEDDIARLRDYYDIHDTSAEMDDGYWVYPEREIVRIEPGGDSLSTM